LEKLRFRLESEYQMSSIQDVVADYEAQIEQARDRIYLFEAGELEFGDKFALSGDWTPEAIAIELQIIADLESGIEILIGT
jgi:hypothetical protein